MDWAHPDSIVRKAAPEASAHEVLRDAELVRGVIDGDEQALRTIWERHVTSVRATLRVCMGADHAIDDLTQDVFISFLKSAKRLREPEALRPYLLGIATRLALLELRSRKRKNRWQRLLHLSKGHDEGICLPDVEERDALRALGQVLQDMPGRECRAFILRYVQDLSPGEIAVALGIPQGSAKRAISVGKKLVLRKARINPSLTDYLQRCREAK